MFLVFQNDLALVELQLYVEFLMCCVHAHETTITCVQKHYLQLCKLYKVAIIYNTLHFIKHVL